MLVDRRFTLDVGEALGATRLSIHAAEELELREPMTRVASFDFDELCGFAGLDGKDREAFDEPGGPAIFSNGWQSWSFGGEVQGRETVRRARFIRKLNVYNEHPATIRKRGELLSHFLTYFRAGDRRLFLVSCGSTEATLPPLCFRIDRSKLELALELYAEGAAFKGGESLAEIAVFHRRGYFEAKDVLRGLFSGYGHFDRLAFLGRDGAIKPGGYESWYNHYLDIDEGILARDIGSISDSPNLINRYYLSRGKPTVFQIDDGWERSVGEWLPDERRFPRGMKVLAEAIEERGMVPGLWIAPLAVTRAAALHSEHPDWLLRDQAGSPVLAGWNPGWGGDFHCLDISLPEVEDYILGVFDTMIEDWGYRYLKLDFLYAGMLRGKHARGGAAYRHYDRLMHRITSRLSDSRGRPLAYLGCGAPLEPSFRHFPLMRIGADTREDWEYPSARLARHQGRPSAYVNLSHTIGKALLDGTVFVSDPDVMFCRSKGMGYGEREKELIAIVDRLLASQVMFSDDTHDFGSGGEAEFTSRIVGLFDRLADREYGVERIEADLYRLFSRDGRICGIINLSDRERVAQLPCPAKAVVERARRRGTALAFEPRSISIYEG
ncbi:MAG TPA: glycoside hydrolase family 36 protein [Rectinemataceae bacterium]|nr:glycoside hydrolase family 36 protein [Rectinemataceae bacterium]